MVGAEDVLALQSQGRGREDTLGNVFGGMASLKVYMLDAPLRIAAVMIGGTSVASVAMDHRSAYGLPDLHDVPLNWDKMEIVENQQTNMQANYVAGRCLVSAVDPLARAAGCKECSSCSRVVGGDVGVAR